MRHASGDTDGRCDACDESDDGVGPHEADIAGEDEDGPFCHCGHTVEVFVGRSVRP